MTHPKIPQTDSIQELARFWDTHNLTWFTSVNPSSDFEYQLE